MGNVKYLIENISLSVNLFIAYKMPVSVFISKPADRRILDDYNTHFRKSQVQKRTYI